MAGGVTTIQEVIHIGSGNGYLQIGASATNLRDFGALDGATTVILTREYLDIEDGQPQMVVKRECLREKATVQCTLKEFRLGDIADSLGLAAARATSEAAAAATAVTETRTLRAQSWTHLTGAPINASPAFIARLASATATVYVEDTDYDIDETAGAIRRISTGAIADGAAIECVYEWDRPARRKLDMGGDQDVGTFFLRFVYTQSNASRQIWEFPIAAPNEAMSHAYDQGDFNKRELVFDAIADPTADVGLRLMRAYHEGAIY